MSALLAPIVHGLTLLFYCVAIGCVVMMIRETFKR